MQYDVSPIVIPSKFHTRGFCLGEHIGIQVRLFCITWKRRRISAVRFFPNCILRIINNVQIDVILLVQWCTCTQTRNSVYTVYTDTFMYRNNAMLQVKRDTKHI
jgi:hypothetical protein